MELKITLNDKNEIERMLLIMEIGMLDSLEGKSVTFEQAYKWFFRPYVAQS